MSAESIRRREAIKSAVGMMVSLRLYLFRKYPSETFVPGFHGYQDEPLFISTAATVKILLDEVRMEKETNKRPTIRGTLEYIVGISDKEIVAIMDAWYKVHDSTSPWLSKDIHYSEILNRVFTACFWALDKEHVLTPAKLHDILERPVETYHQFELKKTKST